MGRHQYYMLLASLPALPGFETASRLPISRERLSSRQSMLLEEDTELMMRAADFFVRYRQSATRSDASMARSFERLEASLVERCVYNLFEFPIDVRTLVTALRYRRKVGRRPERGTVWGVGRLVPHIERHWDAPLFNLGAVYPWLVTLAAYLDAEDASRLDRLIARLVWDRLGRVTPYHPFGIEAVVAYFFKWHILDQWLARDTVRAFNRFDELVTEVTDAWEGCFDGI